MMGIGNSSAEDLDFEFGNHKFDQDDKAQAPSIWESNDDGPWNRDMLTLFVKNQIRVGLALPVLAVVFCAISMLWNPWTTSIAWLAGILVAQAVQIFICKMYLRPSNDKDKHTLGEWIGMLAASEHLFAICWSVPLFLFWEDANSTQQVLTIATLMAVIAVRIMIANSYMPVILAGTGVITMAIVIKCAMVGTPMYIGLGAMALLAEVFFIQLARNLQKTARDMLIFKAQRETLIDELKQAKQDAESGRTRAEVANVAKSRFLATMSHELRTPLNAIMGFSEILSEEMMGPHSVNVYKEYSEDIHHSGNYLLNLINDILDLSRIEAGKHKVNDQTVNLKEILIDAKHLLDMKIAHKNQTLKFEMPDDLPAVCGDERSIRQIWLNLLSNASKFSPPKTQITTGAKHLTNGALSVFVTDEGVGMTQDEIDDVLGMFNRAEDSDRKAIEGAGLGLPIVNGLIHLHSGELVITSEKGKGTTVTVTFPPVRVLSAGQENVLAAIAQAKPTQKALINLTT